MRVRTAFTVVLLSGLAWTGVPSAAADEAPPTQAESSTVTATTEEPVVEPTPGPAEPTSDVTLPESAETSAPKADYVEPSDAESPAGANEPTDEATEAAHATDEGVEPDDARPVEEGVATGATEFGTATAAPEPVGGQETLNRQTLAELTEDPRATIGALNCARLTVSVTLDNSRSTDPNGWYVFDVVVNPMEAGETGESFEVGPGESLVVRIPVRNHMATTVEVWVFDQLLAEKRVDVDCAETRHDPRASAGVVNCVTLTIPVTLDNSRSADMTMFEINVSGDPIFAQNFAAAAGSSKVVTIPVADHQSYGLVVSDAEAAYGSDALLDDYVGVSCQPNERGAFASVGPLDCADVSVDVTLDNSRAVEATTFQVYANIVVNEEEIDRDIEVPAGSIQVVHLGLVDGNDAYISVRDLARPGQESLVQDIVDVACTPGPRHAPRADIGQFCAGRSVPVVLDNRRSTHAVHFNVFVEDGNDGSNEFFSKDFVVSSGAKRTVLVPVPKSIKAVSGFVLDQDYANYVFNPPFVPDNNYLAQFSRTLSFCSRPHTAARPTVAVQGAKFPQAGGVTQLPQTGGLNLALSLHGVALLACGASMLALSGRRRRY